MTEAQTSKQSRNGKKPVAIVNGVTVKVDGQAVTVKGPKGELTRTVRPEVEVSQADGQVTVKPRNGQGKEGLQYQGLSRALISNMIEGVSEGYKKSLDFRGVGYRAEFKDDQLKMTCGLSHQPVVDIPKIVNVRVETIDEAGTKYPRVHLESIDKEAVGRIAALIRSKRPPEPYNGKGVRYTGERIREKAGKAGKAGG
ncbi:MAG: 50S ribosomal protein L6 [Polyangiales bacterium]